MFQKTLFIKTLKYKHKDATALNDALKNLDLEFTAKLAAL